MWRTFLTRMCWQLEQRRLNRNQEPEQKSCHQCGCWDSWPSCRNEGRSMRDQMVCGLSISNNNTTSLWAWNGGLQEKAKKLKDWRQQRNAMRSTGPKRRPPRRLVLRWMKVPPRIVNGRYNSHHAGMIGRQVKSNSIIRFRDTDRQRTKIQTIFVALPTEIIIGIIFCNKWKDWRSQSHQTREWVRGPWNPSGRWLVGAGHMTSWSWGW